MVLIPNGGIRARQDALQATAGPPPPTGEMGPPMGGPGAGGASPTAGPLGEFAQMVMQMPPEEARANIAAAAQMLMQLDQMLSGGQQPQGAGPMAMPQGAPPPGAMQQGPPPMM